jgi:hypothetical protein
VRRPALESGGVRRGDGADVRDVEPSPARQPAQPVPFRRAVTGLGALAVADGDLRTLLRRVAELATEGVPGVDAASVAVGDPAEPEPARHLPRRSRSRGRRPVPDRRRPTFDAYRSGRVAAPATSAAIRATRAHPARAGDVRSAVALAVPGPGADGGAVGVVTLYARARRARRPPGTATRRAVRRRGRSRWSGTRGWSRPCSPSGTAPGRAAAPGPIEQAKA